MDRDDPEKRIAELEGQLAEAKGGFQPGDFSAPPPYPGQPPYPSAPPTPGVFYPPGSGAPGQAGFGQPYDQPNAMPPAGWGSNPGYGAWPPPAGKPPSTWFGTSAWEAAMAKQAHRTIRHLILGLVLFLLAIGFIVVAAVANNFDQVKGFFGM